jgi:hypothetical protein
MLVEVGQTQFHEWSFRSSGHIDRDIWGLWWLQNWTLTDSAEQLGWSVGWLSQVERDVNEPALDDLRNIIPLFGLLTCFFSLLREMKVNTTLSFRLDLIGS